MAQFTRTPASRIIISGVVLIVVIGAAVEYRNRGGSKKPTVPQSLSASSPSPITLKPSGTSSGPLRSTALITETPDPTQHQQGTAPAPPKPVDAGQQASNVQLPATADLIASAKTKVAAGDLLAARKILNDALATGEMSAPDSDAVKKQLADLNQTLIFSPRQFPNDPAGGVYKVKPRENLTAIALAYQVPYEILMQMNRITDAKKLRVGQTLKVIKGPVFAVVTKSKFTLELYLGAPGGAKSLYLCTFPVGLGTENSTPTGTWVITTKLPHPSYDAPDGREGGHFDAGDPKNPIGSYWMGLQGVDGQAMGAQSYGIHGTIDPSSIGKMSSMGCIRLRNDDVDEVAKLLVPAKSNVVVKD